ncbi:hypothetical protein BC832DRAFT_556742 [Gaertneriomyces semiglobifer]|nr:hypothetical protein BC832DRAFT_556742 [Gaertneriomyces semiglobifer]
MASCPEQNISDAVTEGLSYAIAGLGLINQFGVVVYTAHDGYRKRKLFNAMYLLAMVIFLIVFGALMGQTYASYRDNGNACTIQYDAGPNRQLYDGMWRLFNASYMTAGMGYMICFQMRFRLIRIIMPYAKIWDRLLQGVTTTIFVGCMVICVVMYDTFRDDAAFAMGVFTVWLIFVDNMLSFTFLRQLRRHKAILADTTKLARRANKVKVSLIALCVTTWMAVILHFATFVFVWRDERHMNLYHLLIRIVIFISSITFVGAATYMRSIALLMRTDTSGTALPGLSTRGDIALAAKGGKRVEARPSPPAESTNLNTIWQPNPACSSGPSTYPDASGPSTYPDSSGPSTLRGDGIRPL